MLSVQSVSCKFGEYLAVKDVSFQLSEGQIMGIAGTNGAGKSTLFAAIAGQQFVAAGKVEFEGHDITCLAPYRRACLGLGRTFQIPREFGSLTVLQNLLAAAPDPYAQSCWAAYIRTLAQKQFRRRITEEAQAVIDFLNLAKVRNQLAGSLSGGQKKLVELGRVLMLHPKCIMLDEPFAGVNPVLIAEIGEHIRKIREKGIAVIVIEHHLQALKNLADHMILMDKGCILASGDPETVLSDPAVQQAYMGGVV